MSPSLSLLSLSAGSTKAPIAELRSRLRSRLRLRRSGMTSLSIIGRGCGRRQTSWRHMSRSSTSQICCTRADGMTRGGGMESRCSLRRSRTSPATSAGVAQAPEVEKNWPC